MAPHARLRVNWVSGKRLWNVLRVAFFMIRKGLISKRKLITDMNLMMKRGKLLRKSLVNRMSLSLHHHHSRKYVAGGSFGIQEYEFSCSNSPNPVFFHLPKRKHHYFPCIKLPEVTEREQLFEEQSVAVVPKTPEYTFNIRFDDSEGEKRSPILPPFSVRVSNYSSEEESDNASGQVDDDAEEFIERFYEQLRVQSRMQLLQYQDI